ncbi:hypothetical protein [Nocardioides sp. R-C-SC26]|uniref:hypothetical protein n=1 Tax=Nocardioides sp. R-C-SC26 TaxID=2870414 RepID=UPI001E4A0FD7|nr:hypothetical protein [Nocardioides sp. R-C-SC26]
MRLLSGFLLALTLSLSPLGATLPTAAAAPAVEDYPGYQPASHCSPRPRVGTTLLSTFIVRRYGGAFGGISRRCGGSTSEHTEGRAFDWTVSARTAAGRATARALLDDLFATDRFGNDDALARRMGVMYVIWNDRIYSAGRGYAPEPYLNSACRSRKRCSQTLRHRDHVHISLTRRAARGETSWFVRRLLGVAR